MIRVTINFTDEVYEKIKSKKEDKSISRYVNEALNKFFDNENDSNAFKEISNCLAAIDNKVSYLTKKQKIHFTLSLQHFVNQGYSDNLEVRNDKCWKKLEDDLYDKFNN